MDEFREIEERLRQALVHVPAPDGFVERVMARTGGRQDVAPVKPKRAPGTLLRMMPRTARWTAAAAALALTVGGGDALHVRHQHTLQQERAAEAEVDLAMQLTSHALNEVEVNLDRSPAGRFTQLLNARQR